MGSANFFSAVSFGLNKTNFQAFAELVDSYFCLGSEKYHVIPGNRQGTSEGVSAYLEHGSQTATALKVASYLTATVSALILQGGKTSHKKVYAFFVAIPLLTLIAKVFLRSIYKFHLVDAGRPLFAGETSSSKVNFTSSIEKITLEVNKVYRLSPKEMEKLQIISDGTSLEHNLPQISNLTYSVPPRVAMGSSQLDKYESSTFDIECKAGYVDSTGAMVDPYYEVIRRKGDLPREGVIEADALTSYKVLLSEGNRGYSVLMGYAKSYFKCTFNAESGKWEVECGDMKRDYQFLPFNKAVTVNMEDLTKLEVEGATIFKGDSGADWTIYTSKLAEYNNSVILGKQGKEDYVLVRMLKPVITANENKSDIKITNEPPKPGKDEKPLNDVK